VKKIKINGTASQGITFLKSTVVVTILLLIALPFFMEDGQFQELWIYIMQAYAFLSFCFFMIGFFTFKKGGSHFMLLTLLCSLVVVVVGIGSSCSTSTMNF
jgi:hypothetical protein